MAAQSILKSAVLPASPMPLYEIGLCVNPIVLIPFDSLKLVFKVHGKGQMSFQFLHIVSWGQ